MYLTVETETFLHRLHPVTKIILLLLFFVAALLFKRPFPLLILLLILLSLSIRFHLLKVIGRFLKLLILLFAFSLILWSVFSKGEDTVLLRLFFLEIKRASFFHGLTMALRLVDMVVAGLIFLATTPIEEFNAALMLVGLPYRVSFTIGLAFRLVPMLLEIAQTVIQAQKARGLDLNRGGLIKRVRNHFPIMVPVFILALRKVNNMAMALEVRGFGGASRESIYMDFHFGLWDIFTLGSALLINILLYLLDNLV